MTSCDRTRLYPAVGKISPLQQALDRCTDRIDCCTCSGSCDRTREAYKCRAVRGRKRRCISRAG
jgi:hypothetical protein